MTNEQAYTCRYCHRRTHGCADAFEASANPLMTDHIGLCCDCFDKRVGQPPKDRALVRRLCQRVANLRYALEQVPGDGALAALAADYESHREMEEELEAYD